MAPMMRRFITVEFQKDAVHPESVNYNAHETIDRLVLFVM